MNKGTAWWLKVHRLKPCKSINRQPTLSGFPYVTPLFKLNCVVALKVLDLGFIKDRVQGSFEYRDGLNRWLQTSNVQMFFHNQTKRNAPAMLQF